MKQLNLTRSQKAVLVTLHQLNARSVMTAVPAKKRAWTSVDDGVVSRMTARLLEEDRLVAMMDSRAHGAVAFLTDTGAALAHDLICDKHKWESRKIDSAGRVRVLCGVCGIEQHTCKWMDICIYDDKPTAMREMCSICGEVRTDAGE